MLSNHIVRAEAVSPAQNLPCSRRWHPWVLSCSQTSVRFDFIPFSFHHKWLKNMNHKIINVKIQIVGWKWAFQKGRQNFFLVTSDQDFARIQIWLEYVLINRAKVYGIVNNCWLPWVLMCSASVFFPVARIPWIKQLKEKGFILAYTSRCSQSTMMEKSRQQGNKPSGHMVSRIRKQRGSNECTKLLSLHSSFTHSRILAKENCHPQSMGFLIPINVIKMVPYRNGQRHISPVTLDSVKVTISTNY